MNHFKQSFKIGHHTVGLGFEPFIIAEMSGNHNQSLDRALEIVDQVASTGAHALKLQTYTAETMTLDVKEGEFFIDDKDSLWYGRSLYELYQEAYTPWEWHRPIMERCKQHNMLCFSTPFDETAVDFLEELDVPCYKVASFENIDLGLIKKTASTGKPLIISTGMANVAEIFDAVQAVKSEGCDQLILLKCTSTYPASPVDSNIATIPHLKQLFGSLVGLSDHTLGIGAALASVALGANVIEKHVTLSRAEGGVDAAFSLEPSELRWLVEESKRAWQSVGNVSYTISEKEKNSLQFRRTLYISKDMVAGEALTGENVRAVRPGYGLPPKYIDVLLGKKINKACKKGTPITWSLIE